MNASCVAYSSNEESNGNPGGRVKAKTITHPESRKSEMEKQTSGSGSIGRSPLSGDSKIKYPPPEDLGKLKTQETGSRHPGARRKASKSGNLCRDNNQSMAASSDKKNHPNIKTSHGGKASSSKRVQGGQDWNGQQSRGSKKAPSDTHISKQPKDNRSKGELVTNVTDKSLPYSGEDWSGDTDDQQLLLESLAVGLPEVLGDSPEKVETQVPPTGNTCSLNSKGAEETRMKTPGNKSKKKKVPTATLR